MKRFPAPLVALAAGTAVLIGNPPAQAHGSAAGGLLGGLSHPLLGIDHLVMLLAVGTAASFISGRLLLWALGGAAIGAVIGFTGSSLPAAELLAALAISATGLLTLIAARCARASNIRALDTISGLVVGGGLAIHALLHGLEAPHDGSTVVWWSGALLSSVLVCGGSFLLLKKLPVSFTKAAALAFLAIGGLLALAPLALVGAGAS